MKSLITSQEEAEIQDIDQKIIRESFEDPKILFMDFIKYKVFRVLTEEEKALRASLWRLKWQVYSSGSHWRAKLNYHLRIYLNGFGIFYAFFFTVGSIPNLFIPFTDSEIPIGLSTLISLVFIATSIVSLVFFIRLNAIRRIMKETYREVSPQGD